jgi:hypothetical protein
MRQQSQPRRWVGGQSLTSIIWHGNYPFGTLGIKHTSLKANKWTSDNVLGDSNQRQMKIAIVFQSHGME